MHAETTNPNLRKRVSVQSLRGQKVAIIGFGIRTGVASADFLIRNGAIPVIYDAANAESLQEHFALLKTRCPEATEGKSYQLQLQPNDWSWLKDVTLLIASPGVPLNQPWFA